MCIGVVKECKLASQLYSDYGQVKKLTWKTLSKPTELLAIGRVANTPMLQLAKSLLQIFCNCNFLKRQEPITLLCDHNICWVTRLSLWPHSSKEPSMRWTGLGGTNALVVGGLHLVEASMPSSVNVSRL